MIARQIIDNLTAHDVGIILLWEVGAPLGLDDFQTVNAAASDDGPTVSVIGHGADEGQPTIEQLQARLNERQADPQYWSFGEIIPESRYDSVDIEGSGQFQPGSLVIMKDDDDVAFQYDRVAEPAMYKVGPTYGGLTEFYVHLKFRK